MTDETEKKAKRPSKPTIKVKEPKQSNVVPAEKSAVETESETLNADTTSNTDSTAEETTSGASEDLQPVSKVEETPELATDESMPTGRKVKPTLSQIVRWRRLGRR